MILRVHISNQIPTNPVIVRVNPTDNPNLANICVCSGWLAFATAIAYHLNDFQGSER